MRVCSLKNAPLTLIVVETDAISTELRAEILSLCNAAYGEDLTQLFSTFGPATHVLGYVGDTLASHAMWVTRWLQIGNRPPLRTAYVELVATHPQHQRRGYASEVMRRLAAEIPERYELAALSPATSGIYARLGWRFWRGPLAIRMPAGDLQATPDEQIMVLPLPGRPPLNMDAPLSAEWREGEVW